MYYSHVAKLSRLHSQVYLEIICGEETVLWEKNGLFISHVNLQPIKTWISVLWYLWNNESYNESGGILQTVIFQRNSEFNGKHRTGDTCCRNYRFQDMSLPKATNAQNFEFLPRSDFDSIFSFIFSRKFPASVFQIWSRLTLTGSEIKTVEMDQHPKW
jgi:hypothetical protein